MTLRTLALVTILLAACGGAKDAAPSGDAAAPGAAPGAAPAAAPALTGKVITVQLITDAKSNRFEPAEIEAHPGDIIRFTLQVGVHNVHFVADSNPGVTGLPPASELLQLPGQTYDFQVSFPVGTRLYFQCDPHALLGMIGHLTVAAGR